MGIFCKSCVVDYRLTWIGLLIPHTTNMHPISTRVCNLVLNMFEDLINTNGKKIEQNKEKGMITFP